MMVRLLRQDSVSTITFKQEKGLIERRKLGNKDMRKLRFPCIKVPNSKKKKKISVDMEYGCKSMKQKTVDVDVLKQIGLIYESAMGIKATEASCPNISAESFFNSKQ
eukprot:616373_1